MESEKKNDNHQEHEALTHASVLLIREGITAIVLVSNIDGFQPKNKDDYEREKMYVLQLESENNSSSDKFAHVFILRLGSK